MRKRGLTGSFWPTREQEDLLGAALLDGEPALESWLRARSKLDIDRLEEGSYSVLPLVYKQLAEAGVDEPLLPRLKGIYRHTWSKNQVLLGDLRAVAQKLAAAGVETIVVGGAGRLPYYDELGLRTLTEFELLVRETDLEQALRAVGWSGDAVPERVARGRSALRVGGGEHRPFGLHWRFLPEYPAAGSDDVWRSAGRSSLEGVDAFALDPADDLLLTLAGGARTALWANVQWVADATTIIRSGQVDWNRLVAAAEARRATLRVHEALAYVGELVEAPVPTDVLLRLDEVPASRRDVLAHRVSGSGGKVLGELPRTLAGYVRSGDGPRGLPRFLRNAWNVDRGWQLPLVAARKGVATIAARRIRRRGR